MFSDLSISTLLIVLFIVITAHSAPQSKSPVNHHLCPEEFRDLRRLQNDASTDFNDDDDDDNDADRSRENVCEEAMDMVVRHRNIAKLNPSIFLYYCPHYGARLTLIQERNNTICEDRKRASKRKRYDDSSDRDVNYDLDDKRRALSRRELKKRIALRFIRKRMS